jgi:hypothetical protein
MNWIKDRLDAGWFPITIFEELPKNIQVSRSAFYRFLFKHKLSERCCDRRRVVPEILHKPGEALILDWGKLCDIVDETGKKRTVWVLIGVMGFSRYLMARVVWSNDLATTIVAIESMFREIGGVTEKITSDNPKCFSLQASNYDPVLNPAFERFAGHYNFFIECLPPADPTKKGKVERMVPYIRRLYQAHGNDWIGIDESQNYLNGKLEIANKRKHGTTMKQPEDVFINIEADKLKGLPCLTYEIERISDNCAVRVDGHVRFDNKYYSVGKEHIKEKVMVIGNESLVSIYHKGKLLEIHEKITEQFQSKSTKPHHLEPYERIMHDNAHYLKKASSIGPDVEYIVRIILEQGQGFVDTRKIWGILSLDKKYSKEAINQACKDAHDFGKCNYRTVNNFLKLTTIPNTKVPDVELHHNKKQGPQQHKFIRPIKEYQEHVQLSLIQ